MTHPGILDLPQPNSILRMMGLIAMTTRGLIEGIVDVDSDVLYPDVCQDTASVCFVHIGLG